MRTRLNNALRTLWSFVAYVKTEDIDDKGRLRIFPATFQYLVDLWRAVENDSLPVIVITKSRRMLISTFLMVYCLYKMLSTDTRRTGELWSGCVIVKNEEDAKKLIRRMRRIYDRLPSFLQKPLEIDNVMQVGVKGGGYFEGLNAGGQGPRQEGYTLGIMDEAAFQMRSRENYQALRQCARKVIVNSTVNGTGNLHYDLAEGIIPGAHRIRLHYSQHPHRIPGTPEGDEWKSRMMQGQSKVDWDREMEMKTDVFAEPGWYIADWDEACVIDGLGWDQRGIVTISFDPGFVVGAAIVSYVNKYNQWCRLREFMNYDRTTDEFATEVFDWCRAEYRNAQYRLCSDPAASQRGSIRDKMGAITDEEVINRTAASILKQRLSVQYDRIPAMRRKDGHRMIRQQFKIREDGRPGTLIDRLGCPTLLSGFRGGYRQMENATPQQIKLEEPNRSSDHVHICDADRYAVMQFWVKTGIAEYYAPPGRTYEYPEPEIRYDPETGYPRGSTVPW